MKKKLILTIGSITSIAAPIAAVVACNSSEDKMTFNEAFIKANKEYDKDKKQGLFIEGWAKRRLKEEGDELVPRTWTETSIEGFMHRIASYIQFKQNVYIKITINGHEYQVNQGARDKFPDETWNKIYNIRWQDNDPAMHGKLTRAFIEAIVDKGQDRDVLLKMAKLAIENVDLHKAGAYALEPDYDPSKDEKIPVIKFAFTEKGVKEPAKWDVGLQQLFHATGFSRFDVLWDVDKDKYSNEKELVEKIPGYKDKGKLSTPQEKRVHLYHSFYQARDKIDNFGDETKAEAGTIDPKMAKIFISIDGNVYSHEFTPEDAKKFMAITSGPHHATKINELAKLVVNNVEDRNKLLAGSKVALEKSSWHASDAPSIVTAMFLKDMASAHALFHGAGGRTLPEVGIEIKLPVGAETFSYKWTNEDKDSAEAKAYLAKNEDKGKQSHILMYLATKLANGNNENRTKIIEEMKKTVGTFHEIAAELK